MLGLDRSRQAGRWLEWKVRIFTAGAILAVVGMYLDERWMTGAAIVVLLGGFFIRFLPGGEEGGHGELDADGSERPDGPRAS